MHRTTPPNEIRLFEDKGQALQVECPQRVLVRLLHFLSSKGFKCGVARILGAKSQNTRSIVSFSVDGCTLEEVKYSVRIFLSTTKVKFVESSDDIETVFRLVNASLGRS